MTKFVYNGEEKITKTKKRKKRRKVQMPSPVHGQESFGALENSSRRRRRGSQSGQGEIQQQEPGLATRGKPSATKNPRSRS